MQSDFVTPPFIQTYGNIRAAEASSVFSRVSRPAPQTNSTGWEVANAIPIYHVWGREEESRKRVDG